MGGSSSLHLIGRAGIDHTFRYSDYFLKSKLVMVNFLIISGTQSTKFVFPKITIYVGLTEECRVINNFLAWSVNATKKLF